MDRGEGVELRLVYRSKVRRVVVDENSETNGEREPADSGQHGEDKNPHVVDYELALAHRGERVRESGEREVLVQPQCVSSIFKSSKDVQKALISYSNTPFP